MKKGIWIEVKNILLITVASLIYAIGISLFLDPNNLAPGGITGIAVILNSLSGIETGTLYFILNIPIIILGLWKFGIHFIAKTSYAVIAVSAFTNMLTNTGPLTEDLLLAGAVGGILIAIGIGLIFKAGATTGGTDIIIKLLRRKYKHLKTGFLFLCIDVVVVGVSGIVFGDWNLAFYALAAVFINGKALDYVLYGGDEAKMFYIMTESPDEIGRRMMEELGVGVTYLQGKGGWTGDEKRVILSIVPKRMGPQVEEIVKTADSRAFLVVTSASEIYGEGYKDFYADVI